MYSNHLKRTEGTHLKCYDTTQHSDLRRKEPLYEVNQTNTVKFILDHILNNGEEDENNEVNTNRHQ